MAEDIKAMVLGDAMIGYQGFVDAWNKYMTKDFGEDVIADDFESDWDKLQYRRLEVEKNGPSIEPVDPKILEKGKDRELLIGLFIAVSKDVIESMPDLRIVGVSRAGLENVDVNAATEKGVLVFNVQGRNAHAVSDFAVGMMLAEARNIARAHNSIKNGQWQKTFSNSDDIPELTGKTVGLVGFGHIGRLVAKKLSGFDVEVLVYDPYMKDEAFDEASVKKAELNELFEKSDFVSLHARLTEDNKRMIGKEQFDLMKPTAIFVNTSRAGLVDQDALANALREKKIMGAALDVFDTEPIAKDSPFLELDNVTLTTHIAGTTADALRNSPFLLVEDIRRLFDDEDPKFIVNKEVLDNPDFKAWLNSKRA